VKHVLKMGIASLILAVAPLAAAQKAPALQWEGMQKVSWRTFDEAFVAPGINFRPYTKVMIEPVEATFRRNWQRDYNRVNIDLDRRVSDEQAQRILTEAQDGLGDAFVQAARNAGYQIATAPGPDVLRLKVYLTDLDVHAPDLRPSARDRIYSEEAGSGRLVLEVRDSTSDALLAGGVDKRDVGDVSFFIRRSSVTNRADFARAFRRWADFSVEAVEGLGARPPALAAG
jgi:hypothetical protein